MPYYEKTADGSKVKKLSAKWYGCFVDFGGAMRRIPLLEDRRASETLARSVDKLNSLRSSGDKVLPPELARAVEDMPAAIRDKLASWNIIPASKAASSKPLSEHLADFKASLLAKGGTAGHARATSARVQRILEGCKCVTFSDVSASKVQEFVAALRKDRMGADEVVRRGISAASFNYYLRDARSFFRWMVRDGRCHENPLIHLSGMSARADPHDAHQVIYSLALGKVLAAGALPL